MIWGPLDQFRPKWWRNLNVHFFLSGTYWSMKSDEPQVQNVSLFAWRSFGTELHHLFMHSGLNFTNITANMTIEGVEAAASYSNHLYMMWWATGPPMRWNCPRREQKIGIWFFLLFPPTCWEESKSNSWSFCFVFLFSSNKAQKSLSGSVAHRIYWEWPKQ